MYLQIGQELGQTTALYDRNAAINYARRHWNIPCNDRFIALSVQFAKVPAGTTFEHEFDKAGNSRHREHALKPDGSRIEWEDLDDCTHYISCCIGQPPGDIAGGIPISYKQLGSPPKAPYGIVRVSTMVDYLVGKKYATVIDKAKTSDEKPTNKLDPGDLIAYWNKDRGRYSHLAMYLGNGKIGCHTYCRFDDRACTWDNDWDLGRGTHLWTFLHITV